MKPNSHKPVKPTRTFPVNGKFSSVQRDIYQLVRDAQEAFVRQIKVGVSESVASDSGRAGVARVCRADHPRLGAGGDRHLAVSHGLDAAHRRAVRAMFAGVAPAPGPGADVGRRRIDARDANAISGNGPDAILYGVVSLLRLDQYGPR